MPTSCTSPAGAASASSSSGRATSAGRTSTSTWRTFRAERRRARSIAAASLRPRERIQPLAADVRIPDEDRVRDQLSELVRFLRQQRLDLRPILDPQQKPAALPRHERSRTHHLSLGVQLSQVRAMAFDGLLHPVEGEQVLQRHEGIEGHAAACITACGASAWAAAATAAHWTGGRRTPPPPRARPPAPPTPGPP